MQVFAFQSAQDSDVVALTGDETGANLPIELGPWHANGRSAMPIGEGADDIVTALRTEGYYLARTINVGSRPVQH